MVNQSHPIPESQRFLRFLVVGLSGTLIDFSILWLLRSLGLPTLIANTLSFSAGVFNNYTWNRLWTFRDALQEDWSRQLAQFTFISLIGLLLNNLIVLALEAVLRPSLAQPGLSLLLAKCVATGLVVFWNYFANRMWTFRINPLIPQEVPVEQE
jgi:putative flippase GtrA